MKRKIVLSQKSKTIGAIILLMLFGIIGSTIAYYRTNNTFTNEFVTGEYIISTEETFESPSNWKPGDTTPKEITVTNKGNVPAAVKVCMNERWEDENGNSLPLSKNVLVGTTSKPVYASLLNYRENYMGNWLPSCSSNCFYYYKALEPNESTTSLLESVTFNKDFPLDTTTECSDDPVTHTTSCSSTVDDYSGGKYILEVDIETVQYNKYQEVFTYNGYLDNIQDYSGCHDLYIPKSSSYYNNMILPNEHYFGSFGETILNDSYESVRIVENKNIPSNAKKSWDVSVLRDGSVMAWYTDIDNNGMYELYIGANGKVVANPYSNIMFGYYDNTTLFDLRGLDTSKVIDMSSMFYKAGRNKTNLTFMGLENIDLSNVKSISEMFSYAGGLGETIDFSSWDVSNVEYRDCVFLGADFTPIGTDNWEIHCST
ncbi:MAG: BspA family leucine-rich repeat surface protein [Bacilli bacterium]|nr:BspA family leucine-rich repeat surface protein [Bacilli bacterium]